MSVFTASNLIAPVLDACASPKSATYIHGQAPFVSMHHGLNTIVDTSYQMYHEIQPWQQNSHLTECCLT
jgi:hypothetical protein